MPMSVTLLLSKYTEMSEEFFFSISFVRWFARNEQNVNSKAAHTHTCSILFWSAWVTVANLNIMNKKTADSNNNNGFYRKTLCPFARTCVVCSRQLHVNLNKWYSCVRCACAGERRVWVAQRTAHTIDCYDLWVRLRRPWTTCTRMNLKLIKSYNFAGMTYGCEWVIFLFEFDINV